MDGSKRTIKKFNSDTSHNKRKKKTAVLLGSILGFKIAEITAVKSW